MSEAESGRSWPEARFPGWRLRLAGFRRAPGHDWFGGPSAQASLADATEFGLASAVPRR